MIKILSIDGGGIRGIIPATVLTSIEKQTGISIARAFDLVAGTSTGGILVLGLSRSDGNGSAHFKAEDLAALYEKRGKEIFYRSLWKGVSSAGSFLDEKYPCDNLEKILSEYFENEPLGSALTHVLITSYDIQNRQPHFFKSWRDEWKAVEMRYVARATSAAPTYFEPALVPISGSTRALIDGGVFINNPAMSAYAEAKRIFPEENEFFVVSIGSGELVRPIPYDDAKDWGLAGWMLPVMSCMFDGVSDAVNYQLRQILGDHYIRFQTSLSTASDDMDNTTQGNMENLKTEAKKLIRTHKDKLDQICQLISDSNN